jgi:hypothetical protein
VKYVSSHYDLHSAYCYLLGIHYDANGGVAMTDTLRPQPVAPDGPDRDEWLRRKPEWAACQKLCDHLLFSSNIDLSWSSGRAVTWAELVESVPVALGMDESLIDAQQIAYDDHTRDFAKWEAEAQEFIETERAKKC